MMSRSNWIAALLPALWLIAAPSASSAADELKVGFIDMRRVETESRTAQAALQAIRKEFDPRDQELRAMQEKLAALDNQLKTRGATMSEADRQATEREFAAANRRFEQSKQEFSENLELRKREAFQKLGERLSAAIKEVATAGKYDIVFQEVVYSSKQVDITDQVLKAMEK
jgi:outer membrane protein